MKFIYWVFVTAALQLATVTGLTPAHAASRRLKASYRNKYDCGNAQTWQRFGPMCYHVGMLSPSSWIDASARCTLLGGRLAQPHSAELARALATLMCDRGSCWIGMHDTDKDGVLTFVNGSAVHPGVATGWWRDAPVETAQCALLTPHFEAGGGLFWPTSALLVTGTCAKNARIYSLPFLLWQGR